MVGARETTDGLSASHPRPYSSSRQFRAYPHALENLGVRGRAPATATELFINCYPRIRRNCRKAFLSVPHFARKFREYFGISPIELVIALRFEEACHLLRDMNTKIAEVAHMVGYADICHFSNLFKKRMGAGPGEYRRRLKQSGTDYP